MKAIRKAAKAKAHDLELKTAKIEARLARAPDAPLNAELRSSSLFMHRIYPKSAYTFRSDALTLNELVGAAGLDPNQPQGQPQQPAEQRFDPDVDIFSAVKILKQQLDRREAKDAETFGAELPFHPYLFRVSKKIAPRSAFRLTL